MFGTTIGAPSLMNRSLQKNATNFFYLKDIVKNFKFLTRSNVRFIVPDLAPWIDLFLFGKLTSRLLGQQHEECSSFRWNGTQKFQKTFDKAFESTSKGMTKCISVDLWTIAAGPEWLWISILVPVRKE